MSRADITAEDAHFSRVIAKQYERDLEGPTMSSYVERLATTIRNAYEAKDRDALDAALQRMKRMLVYAGPVHQVADLSEEDRRALLRQGGIDGVIVAGPPMRFIQAGEESQFGTVAFEPTTPKRHHYYARANPMPGCTRKGEACQCETSAEANLCMYRGPNAPVQHACPSCGLYSLCDCKPQA